MTAYGVAEEKFHPFLILVLGGESGRLYDLAALPPETLKI